MQLEIAHFRKQNIVFAFPCSECKTKCTCAGRKLLGTASWAVRIFHPCHGQLTIHSELPVQPQMFNFEVLAGRDRLKLGQRAMEAGDEHAH